MKFTLDTEFIDTPTCAHLLSLALVSQSGRDLYLAFDYPKAEITPWLASNVVPWLPARKTSFRDAAQLIRGFVGGHKFDRPEFWCYYGAHDWYWFCRVFGGMMEMPEYYPHRFREFADKGSIKAHHVIKPEHDALNDAKSLMMAMESR